MDERMCARMSRLKARGKFWSTGDDSMACEGGYAMSVGGYLERGCELVLTAVSSGAGVPNARTFSGVQVVILADVVGVVSWGMVLDLRDTGTVLLCWCCSSSS